MTVESIVARFRKMANSMPREGCDWEETPTISEPASAEAINLLKEIADFDLPDELLEFFTITGAVIGMTVHNGYFIGGIDQLVRSAKRRDFALLINERRFVTIGWSGNGDAFLIASNGETYLYRHESATITMIAEGFAAFLSRIADDWHAYLTDAADWRYLTS